VKKRAPCYDVPLWHRTLWEDQAEAPEWAEEFRELAKQGDAKVAGFSDTLVPELFHRFYAEYPREIPVDKIKKSAEMRRRLHNLASELPYFKSLSKRTNRDALWSAMATMSIAGQLAKTLPEPECKGPPRPDVEQFEQLLAAMQRSPDCNVILPTGKPTGSMKDVEKGLDEAQVELAKQTASINESAVRQAYRAACDEAQDHIDECSDALDALGMGEGSATSGRVDPMLAVRVAKRVQNSARLRQIVEMAGRLKSTARAKRATKSEYARSELIGVEPTGEISRLLPSELGHLGHPLRSVDLIRRLGERSALGYQVRGKEKAAKGPIVVGLDCSGSMSGPKDVWANAIALAILDIARAEGRAYKLITYNGAVVNSIGADDPKKVPTDKLLEVLSQSPFGGCDLDVPIAPCLDAVEQAMKTGGVLKRADVILVTDAIAKTIGAKEAVARADRLGAHVYGILVGSNRGATLAAWTHEVVAIADVTRDTPATDMLFGSL
jgi:uncharacterized protein with von Willebrand factor type A (vWA) domain